MVFAVKFVNIIDAAPTTRLDLNDLTAFVTERNGLDLSPPELKRVTVGSMLRDGEDIPASAYANRTLTIDVLCKASSRDTLGTQLQTLGRELDRKNNILKYQEDSATAPVFFRTFRSPSYDIIGRSPGGGTNVWQLIRLRLLCEPFALGVKETATTVTTARDPATGLHFEIAAAAAKGDVAAPLWWRVDGATTLNQTMLAVRQHGTPTTYYRQCEDMVGITGMDAADVDASPAGAGNTVWLVSGDPGGVLELQWAGFPNASGSAGSSVEYRGTYRVFLRCKVSTGTFTIGLDTPYGPAYPVVSVTSTTFRMIDLGLITLPPGQDPVFDGLTNTALAVRTIDLDFLVRRTAGAGTLSMDYAVAVPADEALCFVDWGAHASSLRPVWDGPNDTCYYEHTSGGIGSSAAIISRSGDIPTVQPNTINRFIFLESIVSQNSELQTQTTTWAYFPRWLSPIRPA